MRRSAILLSVVALATAVGCGSADQDSTPAACLNGQRAFLDALSAAPGAVRLSGGVPISDCLVSNQSAGDLASVGGTLVAVATNLNAGAHQDPGGAPTVQLGYLVGAITRGAENTQGIHAEFVRRIEAAALYSPAGKPPPEPFDHTYEKGYAAGKDDG
jgi:hypothetical protein